MDEKNTPRPHREGEGTQRREPPRRPRRKKKKLTTLGVLLYIIFVIGASTLLAALGWVWANDVFALNKAAHTAVVTVPQTYPEEYTFGNLVDELKDQGIIEYKMLFRLYSVFSKAEKKIMPDTYELNTNMDYHALVTSMGSRSSTRMTVSATIPEGYTLAQTFQLLEDKGVTTVAKLTDMAANYDYAFSFLQDLPLGDAKRLEGYLFPDTYEFYLGEDAKTVINKMLANFDRRLTEELRGIIADKDQSIHDIIIIASLIEKETDGSDQTSIASVIYNRLGSNVTNGKLEIDATIQYALPQRKEKLSLEDLEVESPYNTYKYAGLPAGPIANPGMAAIRAAIYPASTSYYWYVLGNDGVHHFFSNYDSFVNYKNSLS